MKNPENDFLGSCALIMVHFTTRFFELYLPVQLLSSNQILMMSIIYAPISHTFYDNCNHSISLLSQTIEKTKIYTKTANKQNRTNTTLRTKSLEYTTSCSLCIVKSTHSIQFFYHSFMQLFISDMSFATDGRRNSVTFIVSFLLFSFFPK